MRQLLHAWGRYGGLLWLLGWLPALGWAQCPVAASCTPGKASSPVAASYAMGIYSVTLGSLSNNTAGYADGYQDYSCTIGTTLAVSTAASISVSTAPAAGGGSAENVRVWIDYNNDGAFATSELAFSSDNKVVHAGTITPPATATLGTRLRMRVAADAADSPIPTPCSTPQYSQTEDYAVTLVANSSAPTAAFGTDATTTCSGCVQLTDHSTGGPTSWRWDFGDNTSSTAQNPRHCYAAAGTYQVRLTATNAAGSSTSAATAITYNSNVPVAASCPGLAATANCCNYGITRVQLGSLDNTSADGSTGYQDFTCTQRTSLAAGVAYTLSVATGGTSRYDIRAWLDANNDGAFSDAEKVLEVLNATAAGAAATFTVPTAAVQGQPLRLRIVADGVGTNPRPCVAPTLGQVEDYTVTVTPNTNAPVAAFSSNYVAGACASTNTYTFTDRSTFAPTSWQWSFSPSAGVSFVNGTSATSQNPQVSFAAAGSYSVTLTASNANGSNTLTMSNYLLVQVPCLSYCASNGGYAGGAASSLWISNVTDGILSNPSGNSVGGYSFYSDPRAVAVLIPNATRTLTVTTNLALAHRTLVWIDYNRDGVFANTAGAGGELLYNGVSNGTQPTTTFTFTAPTVVALTRMRVLVTQGAGANACATNFGEGEVEDYLVSTVVLGTAPAQALPALTLSPNPTPDGAVQLQLADASANGRYLVEVQSVLGAQLLRQPVQLRAGQPTPLGLATLPAGLYLVRLTSERGEVAVRRVVRQ